MGVRQPETDAEVLATLAPVSSHGWRDLFAMPLWTERTSPANDVAEALVQRLYKLGVVVPFDWPDWYSQARNPPMEGKGRR